MGEGIDQRQVEELVESLRTQSSFNLYQHKILDYVIFSTPQLFEKEGHRSRQ